MKRVKGMMLALLVCGGALATSSAHADSAPGPVCSEGKACRSSSGKEDGLCEYGPCWICDTDGKAINFPCLRCKDPEELAAAGAPSLPPGPEPTCPKDEDDDGGCTVHQLGSERGIGAIFLAVGLSAFLLARRRG
jgi:hypothetical protein